MRKTDRIFVTVFSILICVFLFIIPLFAQENAQESAEPSTNFENASETDSESTYHTNKTEWGVFFEDKILPNVVSVVTALTALYLTLTPLLSRVRRTNAMIEQSSKRVDDAASLAEKSRMEYEETSGNIRKNSETVAGFESRLSLVEKQNREIISILKKGFCNMDEMVKKGYAAKIANIGDDGEEELMDEVKK